MGKALSGELSCPCDRSCLHRTGVVNDVMYTCQSVITCVVIRFYDMSQGLTNQ